MKNNRNNCYNKKIMIPIVILINTFNVSSNRYKYFSFNNKEEDKEDNTNKENNNNRKLGVFKSKK